jgi:hypothetical protein
LSYTVYSCRNYCAITIGRQVLTSEYKPIEGSVQYQSLGLKERNLILPSVANHLLCPELTLISSKMKSSFGAERLAESRFRFFINLLKEACISILDPTVSISYRVYCVLCYVAEYSTLVAMILEIYFRAEDFDHSMEVAMILMLFLGITFVQFYFR